MNTNIKPSEAALGIKPVGAKGFPAILTQLLHRRGAPQRTRGLAQSAGIMVNYRYGLDDLEQNHEAYSRDGRVIACSTVRCLASGALRMSHATE